MRLDHIIWGVGDLDAAQARVERELGLPVEPGGSHEEQGTHNRIVPLRGAYLELLAIRDREEAAASPVGALLLERIEAGDGFVAGRAGSTTSMPPRSAWAASSTRCGAGRAWGT